jgi:RNA polymerase sigma factor (sigma-70 family)
MTELGPGSGSPPPASGFPATQWSVVLRVGSESPARAREALESLCQLYWYPLYAFLRRMGRPHHEAEDGTQGFLAHLLSSTALQRADPDRGRFRTYLLTAFRHYLANELRREKAVKRGGGMVLVPYLSESAEEQYLQQEQAGPVKPEVAFDRDWATGLIERTVRELREEYRRGRRETVFDALAPLVWGQETSERVAQAAEQLKMTPPALTVALHRLRRRVGERLREKVAETVADPAEVDAELRHLIQVVADPTETG